MFHTGVVHAVSHRRYGLRDQPVASTDTALQAALREIDTQQQDAETRADCLADVVLLRPVGYVLCYSRQTTLQEVVQQGPCDSQLMKHYPHKPYSGRPR